VASSLLALLDDIASLLDDVSALTKVATQKTAGVLGDDLALNAQQVAGLRADRELPIVWAVAKGSLLNKALLVPSALAISAFAPWAVMPLLMIGGAYLCYEGFEKLAHKFLYSPAKDDAHRAERVRARSDPGIDLVSAEKAKIKGAVRTDFVLSAEIIVIALGIVSGAPFMTQGAVLVGIALLMTAGVYGLVGGIVKLDDGGLYLNRREGDAVVARIQRRIGASILKAAPFLMKGLSIAGTAAMFLVGGGILAHGIPGLHGWIGDLSEGLAARPGIGGMLRLATSLLLDALVGVVAGALVLAVVNGVQRVLRPQTRAKSSKPGQAP
jgi:predicted DNA repair protein MutK